MEGIEEVEFVIFVFREFKNLFFQFNKYLLSIIFLLDIVLGGRFEIVNNIDLVFVFIEFLGKIYDYFIFMVFFDDCYDRGSVQSFGDIYFRRVKQCRKLENIFWKQ